MIMENIAKIAHALVKAQSEMSNAKKGSANPFFKSKYADLNSIREAVLPVLNSHGITVLQPTCQFEGKNFVRTILLHESGEYLESITEILFSKVNDAQAQGSGISYARRYGLQSFVCIGADDDDGQKAIQPPKAKAAEKQTLNQSQFEKVISSDAETVAKYLNAIEDGKLELDSVRTQILSDRFVQLQQEENGSK